MLELLKSLLFAVVMVPVVMALILGLIYGFGEVFNVFQSGPFERKPHPALTVPHPDTRWRRPAGIPQVISRFADKPHDKLSRNVILFLYNEE